MAEPEILMTNASINGLASFEVIDELGQPRQIALTGEKPLTIYLDKVEIVTLMTMGSQPELLTLGYLRNQGLIQEIDDVVSVQVDWEVEAVVVVTRSPSILDTEKKLFKRTITSGCGQGTMFGNAMDTLKDTVLECPLFSSQTIYQLLSALQDYNEVYKTAGAVHGCALCTMQAKIELFVEDVGRHNAVDAISGWMWLEQLSGKNKVFYTTGRLTSEMVIKVAQMGIPLLLSRSGVTEMGLQIAKQLGIGLVARAKGKHFLVFNGLEFFEP